jgi:hypothetical protein
MSWVNNQLSLRRMAPEKQFPASGFSESLVVLSTLALFVIINLATATRFPVVWVDEVCYTDPAANLLMGNGFTSSAWPFQARDHFWASRVPLHQALLWGWMKLFGFGPVAARSINYFLMAAAGWLLWRAVARLGLVSAPRTRIFLLWIVLLEYGTSLAYRSGRYDSLTILLSVAAALAFVIPTTLTRCLALVAIGSLCALAGLQLLPFALLFCAVLVVFARGRFLRECAALGFGMMLGFGFFYLLCSAKGVWPDFIAATRSGRQASGNLSHDPSLPPLFLGALLLAVEQARHARLNPRSPLVFGLVGCVVVLVGMKHLAVFPTYYTWMVSIPLAVGVCSALSNESLTLKKPLVALGAASVVVACLAGLPLQLASAAFFWQERDYARVESFVQRNVHSNDWVCCEPAAYYAVKKRAAALFLPEYCLTTPKENARLNLLIIHPVRARELTALLGGDWIRSPDELPPGSRKFPCFKPGFGDKFIDTYNLQVWRKAPAASPSSPAQTGKGRNPPPTSGRGIP